MTAPGPNSVLPLPFLRPNNIHAHKDFLSSVRPVPWFPKDHSAGPYAEEQPHPTNDCLVGCLLVLRRLGVEGQNTLWGLEMFVTEEPPSGGETPSPLRRNCQTN